jgi:hypothetical protein
MGWPRDTTVFPEPTWWNGDYTDADIEQMDHRDGAQADGIHCPQCGEPRPHYKDGMCELCWIEEHEGD